VKHNRAARSSWASVWCDWSVHYHALITPSERLGACFIDRRGELFCGTATETWRRHRPDALTKVQCLSSSVDTHVGYAFARHGQSVAQVYVPNLGGASRVFEDRVTVRLRRATTNGRLSALHGCCVCRYTYCMNISGNGRLGSGMRVVVTAPLAEPPTCKHVNQYHTFPFTLKIHNFTHRALQASKRNAKLERTSAHAVSLLAGLDF
jgi:hypothetical protein